MQNRYFKKYQNVMDDFRKNEKQSGVHDTHDFQDLGLGSDAEIGTSLPADTFRKFTGSGKNHHLGNSPDYFRFAFADDFPEFGTSEAKSNSGQLDEFPKPRDLETETNDSLFSARKASYPENRQDPFSGNLKTLDRFF